MTKYTDADIQPVVIKPTKAELLRQRAAAEQAARNQADADPSAAGICYRKGTLTLKQYRAIHKI